MKNKHRAALALVSTILFAAAFSQAQNAPAISLAPEMTLESDGTINIGDLNAHVAHYDGSWAMSVQNDAFQPSTKPAPATKPGAHVISGDLPVASGTFKYAEVVQTTDGGFNYTANVTSEKGVETNDLAVVLALPQDKFLGKSLTIDQKPVELPKTQPATGSAGFFTSDAVHEVIIPTETGSLMISGDFGLLVQDDREWNGDQYEMRIHFTPNTGAVKDSKIELKFKLAPSTKPAGK